MANNSITFEQREIRQEIPVNPEMKILKGDPGKSAYDLAVELGFEGTLEEWLDSLHGEQGEPGEKGEPGQQGIGILSVEQTTTSEEDGGENVITITLTNGQKSTFTVKNGSKGNSESGGDVPEVTSESIKEALGYTPAKQEDINKLQEVKVVVSNDEPEDGALWIEPDSDEEVILAEIDDKTVSEEMTWSSQKINAMFTEYVDEIAELVGGDA